MAENSNYIGVAMGLDVTDLKAGLSEANKQIQLANSEFKAASSGMDDWTKSTEGITAKITQLDTVLTAQKSKLAGLQAEYNKVVASQGEGSAAAQKLKVQINNQQAAVNTTQKEFNNYTQTLKQAESGEIDLATASLKSGKAVKQSGDDAKKAGDGFTVMKGAIAGLIANGLTALVGACKNAISTLYGLSDATMEYREDIGKLQTAFADAGHTTEQATATYKELYSVFGEEDRAVEAAQQIAKLAQTEDDMVKMTNIATGVWGTFGDSLPAEALMETINSTSKIGVVQGNLADALEWSGVNLDDFNAKLGTMSTEEQRATYITDTLNGIYGEAANKYREVNGSIIDAREAQSNLTDATAKLGSITEPITTKIKEGFTQILLKLVELTEDIDLEAFGRAIVSAFDTFVNDILPKIISGLQWIIDNRTAILTTIVAIGAAFVAWKVVGIVQAATKALKGMTVAQAALNLVMSANPIGLVIAAIAALVAAFVVLWNKSEAFRNFFINMWENIKNAASLAWNAIVKFFTDAWAKIVAIWSGAGRWFSQKWSEIKSAFSSVVSWFSNLFTNAWNGIKKAFSNVKSFFTTIVNNIKSAFSGIRDEFISVGTDIVKGIWDGITNGASWLKKKISGFAGDVSGWFKDTFKIGSPSKLMADEVGIYVGEGVGEGILDSMPYVKKDLSKFSSFVGSNLSGIKGGLTASGINNTMSGINGANGGSGATVVNAGMTVNYNGTLSRKELRKIEQDNDRRVITKLKLQGV